MNKPTVIILIQEIAPLMFILSLVRLSCLQNNLNVDQPSQYIIDDDGTVYVTC